MMGVANRLGRLLPNLGGPDTRVRKLYAGVVHAVALYGAPVWSAEALRSRQIQITILRKAQRRAAIRVIKAYRTVSHTAAITLAGYPSLELIADMYTIVYQKVRLVRDANEMVTDLMRAHIKTQARRDLMVKWQRYLATPNLPGGVIVAAIRQRLPLWTDRN